MGYSGSSLYSPVLGKLRQEDAKSETGLAYIVRLCLKDKVNQGNLIMAGASKRRIKRPGSCPTFCDLLCDLG